MGSNKLRKILFTIALLLIFCLFIKWNFPGIWILCLKKYMVIFFKKDSTIFLELPHINCSEKPPFLVILVTSSYNQSKQRMAIRETWGKERIILDKLVTTCFLLGTTLRGDDLIKAENMKYGDIVQKDFIDAYYNLTLKTIMGIEWIHKFCPQSSFVMKTDSDVFVNTYYLIELLLKKNRNTRFFTGFLKQHDKPIRASGSKWYVSKKEYPLEKYPPFCSGTGYVFSTDVASEVYNIYENIPFLKLEDVFIGLCLAKLKISLEEMSSNQTFFPGRVEFSICRFKKIVTSHQIKPNELLIYWNALERSMDEECRKS